MKHRRIADLHVANVLARGLHDAKRDVERLQVLDETSAVLPEVHGLAETVGVARGQIDLLSLRELEDRRQTQGSVEVDVKVSLRKLLDQLE
jgi:hypothetical protein